eukprot:XP_002931515.3 PREDICTED: pappalysin-2 [Xenopus tropicalis]
MELLGLYVWSVCLLCCWARPQRDDPIHRHKQELRVREDHLRQQSLKEPCRLGRNTRSQYDPQYSHFKAYPAQKHHSKAEKGKLRSHQHGSNTFENGQVKKEKVSVNTSASQKTLQGYRPSNQIVLNGKVSKMVNGSYSQNQKYKRTIRQIAQTAAKKRNPRHTAINVSEEIMSDYLMPIDLSQDQSIHGSMYFPGVHSQLVLRPDVELQIPREKFTVEMWVMPEGGQNDPAVIASMFDNCSHVVSDRGWSLGIRPVVPGSKRDAHFYFTIRTDRSQNVTTLLSSFRYKPSVWTHLAATYDGHMVSLYVDGILISRSYGQVGSLHSPYISLCRSLMLGGDNSQSGNCFRGHIFSLRLWSEPRTQKQLRDAAQGESEIFPNNHFLTFPPENMWASYKEGIFPEINMDLTPEIDMMSPPLLPPCGRTLCDLPDVIAGYSRPGVNWEKEVRYRVVNLCDDDGSRPLVSAEQICRQHQALSDAYSPLGIKWQLNVQEIHNSSLRNRAVLPGCEPGRVGNEHCDPECRHPLTGFDGGDCGLYRPCNPRKRGDGVCHPECNTARDDYDDGDCCPTQESGRSSKNCFDPDAQGRAYMSVKELKDMLQLNNTLYLNVYFASSGGEGLAGSATWPWDKEALGHQGGLVLNPSYYGMSGHVNTMIHEVGHALGLYHVFKGVSERESCDDPCSETEPSMETGDLCEDTAPTPKNTFCRDPDPQNDTCGPTFYTGTPFNNYMSYTDDDCANSFTPNQVARMHCYLDLKYQEWTKSQRPSPVPLPPVVIKQSLDSLTIHWLPPLSGKLYERDSTSTCESCSSDGSFYQYAYHASSPRICDSSGYWTPEEAVGPPDVDQPCEPSLQAWSPELHLYHTNMTVPCPQPNGCMLELHFQHPVLPQSITIWITYLSPNVVRSVSDLEVLLEHGETIDLGMMEAFCDMPLTVRLTPDQKVTGVRIYTFDERMEIDAALLISTPHNPLCSVCTPIRYKVLRDPPFQRDHHGIWTQNQNSFTDIEVIPGQRYQYQVQVAAGTLVGEPSPPLTHLHGAPFCGDGVINTEQGEECDDRGLNDGDGCSHKCQQEPNYSCRGEPSLCYIQFEDSANILYDNLLISRSSGWPAIQEYVDQWASQATTSHQDPHKCPVSAITREPVLKTCHARNFEPLFWTHSAWFPCTAANNMSLEQHVWLKVNFDNPRSAHSFHVYLAADGSLPEGTQRPTVTAHITDIMGQNQSLGTFELSCKRNPLILSGSHSGNSPLYSAVSLTLNFSSPLAGIYGVMMRSLADLHHPEMWMDQAQDGVGSSSCTPLNIAHGSTHCSLEENEQLHCSVICNEGHVVHAVSKGRNSVMQVAVLGCFAGHWNMSVTCIPQDCGPPAPSLVFNATFSCPEGTTLGKHCFFHCLPPAKFQGISHWVTCMWDGLWSLPNGYCKLECEAPEVIPHSRLLTSRCLHGNHDVGSVCRYRCKPGYHVAEHTERRTRRKFLKIHCLQTGLWAEGRCIPVMCDPLPPILQGLYNCSKGLEVDSKCTLYCGSHTVSTVCSKDGSWTEKLSLCEGLQGTCIPPPEMNHIQYTCDNGHSIGSVCTASCIYPLSDAVVLPENITADTMEHWMIPAKVQGIMCTGILKWHPEPFALHCIPSCEPFLADGWCDTINNRAYCQYDGGDCCASTLSSHKVIPFAADCEEDECTCRDPDAEENRIHRPEAH